MCMARKKKTTVEVFRENLRNLINEKGWSNRGLERKSGVSDRMIGKVLNGESKPSVEIAEKLAKPFGLTGWQMLLPTLVNDPASNAKLSQLVDSYTKANKEGKDLILTLADNQAKYSS